METLRECEPPSSDICRNDTCRQLLTPWIVSHYPAPRTSAVA